MAYLSNASFQNGLIYPVPASGAPFPYPNGSTWKANYNAPAVQLAPVSPDDSAFTGNAFIRASTVGIVGSVACDFTIFPTMQLGPNLNADGAPENTFGFPASVAAMAWLRAAPGTPKISGSFAIWWLNRQPYNPTTPDAPNIPVANSTAFTVEAEWAMVTDIFDKFFSQNAINPYIFTQPLIMRVEFYIETLSVEGDAASQLDIGGVVVT